MAQRMSDLLPTAIRLTKISDTFLAENGAIRSTFPDERQEEQAKQQNSAKIRCRLRWRFWLIAILKR